MAIYSGYNPNPRGKSVGDCTIRALTKALDKDWNEAYMTLVIEGLCMCDMPSSNAVWGNVLKAAGFKRYILPDTCPDCYTIRQFCDDYPQGVYVVGTGSHVVCVKDGCYYDSWDSGDETPVYYFYRED